MNNNKKNQNNTDANEHIFNQKGGNGKIIPEYNMEKNNPSIPNETKQIVQQRFLENPPKEQKPIINFQYYQPPRPPKDKAQDMSQYGPVFPVNPVGPYDSRYFGMPFYNNSMPIMMPPIVKNINVNTDGPGANHSRLAVIYEDVMPVRPFNPSSTTLGERLNMYQFIRSSIFSNTDGKDITMNTLTQVGGGPSLLSFIKFGDLNPYNTYKISNNLYKGLPEGYLIYRSCYPVREEAGSTICSKDSTSINVRIYKMLEGSFAVNRINPNIFYYYDEWREVAFYEYIRENIIKKKVCPNFPTIYGYFISEKCGIDFDAIEIAKDNMSDKPRQPNFIRSNPTLANNSITHNFTGMNNDIPQINQTHTINNTNNIVNKLPEPFITHLSPMSDIYQDPNELEEIKQLFTPSVYKITRPTIGLNPAKYYDGTHNNNNYVETNPNVYAGKTLVLLTESPTYNLIGWATRTYEHRGIARVMINRGVHTSNEWMNILFQMMAALYTMQLYGIYIKNFSLENNILVKDLTLRGAVTNYWKYKIDGIDYYVPNLGYLVMIDSNFKDLLNNSATRTEGTFIKKNTNNTGKLGGRFLGSHLNLNNNEVNDRIFKMFISAFNINIFDKEFDESGGCRPPTDIIDLINKIYSEASSDTNKDIKKYILKYMTKYIHNRTGTYLKDSEISNIRKSDTREFVKGQIIVHEDNYGTYKFVMFLSLSDGLCNVLSKNNADDEDIIELNNVPITSLHNYSKAEPITQSFRSNESNLNEEELLETYILK